MELGEMAKDDYELTSISWAQNLAEQTYTTTCLQDS